MELTSDFFQQASKVLTVTELTRSIRNTLEVKFGAVWVQGEISNYKLHPSGHQYFTLKDARAQIACVIFRNAMPPSRTVVADLDQPGARAGNRRGPRDRRRDSRASHAKRSLASSRSYRGDARRREHRRFMGVQRRDCRPSNISLRGANYLSSGSRN